VNAIATAQSASETVSLREVLDLPVLRGARTVAGEGGLDRRVWRVNVMEVPDILGWVQAGELLLTTAYPLRDDRARLLELVPALAERGLAGLALKPARYIDAIPDAMIEAADRLSFPLIELPPDASFNEIITAVLDVILNAQAARLRRSAEIHERFTSIVLGGGGLRQIAEALAELIDRPVAIVDAQHTIQAVVRGAGALGSPGSSLALGGEPALPPGASGASANTIADPGGGLRTVHLGEERVVVQPIQVGTERFGSIVVIEPGGETGEPAAEAVDAIEYAATVAALRQVQARGVAEADRRFQAVCLEELVTGRVERPVLMERANAFGWDLSVPRAALIARLETIGGTPFAELAGSTAEATARWRLADAARTALGRGAIAWERSADVAALGPVSDVREEPEAAAAARRFLAEVTRTLPDAVVSVGIGRPRADPLALAESYGEARRALEIGRGSRGPGHVSVFGELGIDRLLVHVPDAEQADFAETMLGLLLAHDARHRTDLLPTLETFLATRNAASTARRLFVHYNTVKGRLRVIEEILGPVLDDPDRCLGLALALRIRRSPEI
jgi:purine catabolism regulator